MSTIQKHGSGFTIVELLIVIVVIGILAAITVVAYNGVSTKAKTTAAKSAAAAVAKKAEVYKVETGSYPVLSTDLTAAGASASYFLSGVTFLSAMPGTAPADPSSVILTKCDNSGGLTGGTGNQVAYWDYTAGGITSIDVGAFTGCTLAV